MPAKSAARPTLRDRLSHLTPAQAAKWLGPNGARLMRKPEPMEIDFANILLEDHLLQVTWPRSDEAPVVVTLSSSPVSRDEVHCTCSERETAGG